MPADSAAKAVRRLSQNREARTLGEADMFGSFSTPSGGQLTPRRLLADQVALIEAAGCVQVESDLREIRRQFDILDEIRTRTLTRRSATIMRREERQAWRVIEQRAARAQRKLAREEIAA